jgi:catalase
MHRQAINRGRVAYEPNSLGGGCPFQAGKMGFVSYPEPRQADDHKIRGKAERFADHYTQATLFWNSQTDVEKHHIINAFRFELSRVQTPAIRERMVAGLANVATELAQAVATGLGLRELPPPLPKVMERDLTPEVTTSPALSLFSRPGDGRIEARRVAVLVGEGSDLEAVQPLLARLTQEGAVARLLGSRLGTVPTAGGAMAEVDSPIDAMPSVLWDAVVVPDQSMGLAADGRALEFLKDQYRHCKTMLAIGSSADLLARAGIPTTLTDGSADPGLLLAAPGEVDADAFVAALARHRHFERETDPPRV